MANMQSWEKLSRTKKIIFTALAVFVVLGIIGSFIPDNPAENADNKTAPNTSEQSTKLNETSSPAESDKSNELQSKTTEIKMDDLSGFKLSSQQGSIYSYNALGKNQSVSVGKGLENLEGHQDLYPLSRARVTIAELPIEIGYNEADDYGREAYTSVSFDFKFKDKNFSGEISNLDFKPNKDDLRKVLDMFISSLINAN